MPGSRAPFFRIERGRERQPFETGRIDYDRDRHRDGVAPEIIRPEKLRDEEPEREVEGCVDKEGEDDRHR
jgi:hypothetical protein